MSSAKNRWLGSLGLRLTGWYLLVFLASTFILAAAADLRIRASMREQILHTLSNSLSRHKRAFEQEGIEGLRRLAKSPQDGERLLYVRVVDRSDVTLFEKPNLALSFAPDRFAVQDSPREMHSIRERSTGSLWNLTAAPLSDGRWLQIGVSDEESREMVGHLRTGLVAVWIGAVLLGLLGGFLLTRRALRPVQRLAATARDVIESGDLGLRVAERGTRDELDELSHLFNGVLARNESLVKSMREVLDNVAHDLRTPLARLRTGAEVALREVADPERMREVLADTLEESDRVLAMLKTLMDITGAETGVMKLDRTTIDISDLAHDAVDVYHDVAEEKGVRLVTHLESGASVKADRVRMGQVVANLMDNAIKYTTTGGNVEITTARGPAWITLVVKDSGMGIAAEDLPRVWRRFYRADRSRSEPGLGLGLSLVKAIVEAHGGQAEVESAEGAGSTFTIRLPVNVETPASRSTPSPASIGST
jgi:signal transduction histidine kinase